MSIYVKQNSKAYFVVKRRMTSLTRLVDIITTCYLCECGPTVNALRRSIAEVKQCWSVIG
jgi:hypothetical protein